MIDRVKRDIEMNCLTYKGGLELIIMQIENLREQDSLLTRDKIKTYYVVKKEPKESPRERFVKITLAQVGFVSGGAQVFGGMGVCAASLGAACAAYGVPMMIQGTNNTYENGYYLLFRESKSGIVKDAYRYVASQLGYGHREADFIYGGVDVILTGYGAFRNVLLPREKSWSLFRHVRIDYIRGWQDATKVSLGVDSLGTVGTGWQMYTLYKEKRQ